jgi:hypothetical protein
MAVHLILVSVNRVHRSLHGSVQVVSDCLGALQQVTYLPPYHIPSRCKHSNIFKNILVNCGDLTFSVHYSHVKAHQDNTAAFDKLSRKSQLNCNVITLPSSASIRKTPIRRGEACSSHSSQSEYSLGPRNYCQKQAPSSNFTPISGWPGVSFTGRKYCCGTSLTRLTGNRSRRLCTRCPGYSKYGQQSTYWG